MYIHCRYSFFPFQTNQFISALQDSDWLKSLKSTINLSIVVYAANTIQFTHTHLSIVYTKLHGYMYKTKSMQNITKKKYAWREWVGWMLLRVRAYHLSSFNAYVHGWYCLKCHYIWYSEINLEQVDIGVFMSTHATQAGKVLEFGYAILQIETRLVWCGILYGVTKRFIQFARWWLWRFKSCGLTILCMFCKAAAPPHNRWGYIFHQTQIHVWKIYIFFY